LVAVVEEVAGGDEAVATIVTRSAGYEDALACVERLEFEDWARLVWGSVGGSAWWSFLELEN
jgi:hypothetical protein